MCADFKYGVLEFSFLKPVKPSEATRAGHFFTEITHRENAECSSNSFLVQARQSFIGTCTRTCAMLHTFVIKSL